LPIEVKASTNVRSRSLTQFLSVNPELRGIRFSLADYIRQDRLTNYPLYLLPYYFSNGEVAVQQ
ncbi:MAG: hypothetical protein K2K47_00445, partial [Duncaniella sp.]|nr:hypothetical protein [Duncaniella sp.]